MALVAACRPQMLVGSFLILPFFWQYVKESFSRSGERKALFIRIFWTALPYVIVAGLLMYYNWARFGSPFDFGANYNLTTNDMTHRGFHLDRLPFGLFMYLIQPPEFTGTFPFMTPSHIDTNYQGTTIMETMYGGFFWFNLITGAVLFIRQAKNSLKEKGLWGITVLSLVMAVVVVCADIQMAGILQRYGCDFGIFYAALDCPDPNGPLQPGLEKAGIEKSLNKNIFPGFYRYGCCQFLLGFGKVRGRPYGCPLYFIFIKFCCILPLFAQIKIFCRGSCLIVKLLDLCSCLVIIFIL